MNSYYTNQNYKYPELCIVKEEFNITEPGIVKCYIPAIMPMIKEGKPKKTKLRPSNSHLENEDKDDIEPTDDVHIANYIKVRLPNHITDVTRDTIIVPEWTDKLFDFPEDIYPPDKEEEEGDDEDETETRPGEDSEEEEGFDESEEEQNVDHDLETGEEGEKEEDNEGDDGEEDEIEEPEVEEDEFIYKFTPSMFMPMFPMLRRLRVRKRYFFPLSRYDEEKKILYAEEGQKFIAVFIGGDINNIKIIGRYDECQLQKPTVSPTYLASDAQSISQIIGLP